MKRLLIVAACLVLAAPLRAEKPRHRSLSAPTATTTVGNGTPLRIVIGDDTSMQVYNPTLVDPTTGTPILTGQFYPPGTGPGETTEAGIYVRVGGVTYGPDDTGFTPVSMSAVTGTGTAVDPWTLVIVVDAGATGLRLTETLTYVDGAPLFGIALGFENRTDVALTWDTLIGADLYLAGNDAGFPFATPGGTAGSTAADTTCVQHWQYSIAFLGTTVADRYSANGYGTVWSEISSGVLSDTVATTCLDDGAALEWTARTLNPGGTLTINTGVSFTGQLIPVASAVVPALSPKAVAALVLLLAAVGYVLARKTSLGA